MPLWSALQCKLYVGDGASQGLPSVEGCIEVIEMGGCSVVPYATFVCPIDVGSMGRRGFLVAVWVVGGCRG